MWVDSYAKINLSLRVQPPTGSGMHPLHSLALTVDWADLVGLRPAGEDAFTVEGGEVPADGSNLAVRALEAVRDVTGRRPPVHLHLAKRLPVAAGLGGGSSDAAAVLAMAAGSLRLDPRGRDALAPGLGADVMLFLVGGLVHVDGYGERVRRAGPVPDAHAAVVVPPFALPTPHVYRRWDALEGPAGVPVPARHVPPALRNHGPFANDLTPAAVGLAPDLGDWIADLGRAWGVPAMMSGSGPALFGLFPTRDEADAAAAAIPGARAARGCSPTGRGRAEVEGPGVG